MQTPITDALNDLSAAPPAAGMLDALAFLNRPDVQALAGIAFVVASWCVTRNPRRTLAFAALTAVAAGLMQLIALAVPLLSLALMPLWFLALTQAAYWGSTSGDRLEWLWEGVPGTASEELIAGVAVSTVGLIIFAGTAAIAIANPNLDHSMRFGPNSLDWAYALVGILGLISSLPFLASGGLAMLKGFFGVVGTVTDRKWRRRQKALRAASGEA